MNKKYLLPIFLMFVFSSFAFALTENDPNSVAYYSGDDSTLNITISGTPLGASGKINGAIDFDGSSDSITVPDYAFTNKHTVSLWIKFDTLGTEYIIDKRNGLNAGWFIYTTSAGAVQFGYKDGSNNLYYTSGDGYVTTGTWYHLVMVLDDDDIYAYKDASQNTANIAGFGNADNTNDLKIGASGSFDGLIDDFRIYDIALTNTQVTNLYNSGNAFEEENISETDLIFHSTMNMLWDYDNSMTDETINGNPTETTGNVAGAIDFDGSGDYLNLGNIDYSTKSISWWFKTTDTETHMVSKWAGSGNRWSIHLTSGTMDFYIDGSGWQTIKTGMNDGNWHHVVYTLTGTNNKFYIDGNSELNYTHTHGGNSNDLWIGGQNTGTGDYDGLIDDFRIYDIALTNTQITNLYNSGNAFEEETISATDLVYHNTMNGLPNDLTNNGASITTSGILNSAYSLDGSNDYITVPAINGIGGEWSVSTWIKTSATNDYTGIYYDAGGTLAIGLQIMPGNKIRFAYEVGSSITTTDVEDGNWHHIVGVWTGSETQIWVDGLMEDSDSVTNSRTDLPSMYIGDDSCCSIRHFNGLIDEVSVWSKALNTTEITDLYQNGTPTSLQQYPFTVDTVSAPLVVTANSIWTGNSINSFSVLTNETDTSFSLLNNTGGTVVNRVFSGDAYLIHDTTKGIYNLTIPSSCLESYDIEISKLDGVPVDRWVCDSPEFTVVIGNVSDFAFTNNLSIQFQENTKIYTTSTGSITTNLLQNDTNTYKLKISSDGWFPVTINNYNISTTLEQTLTQTYITLYLRFDSLDIFDFGNVTVTDQNNNITKNIQNGTILINPESGQINFSFSDSNTYLQDFNQVLTFSGLDNETINITVTELENILTFNDITNDNPIENATITITYPSGQTRQLITNSTGQIQFAYDYNGTLELGNYSFLIDKLNYINQTFAETINQTNVPFIKTYNVSRAVININVYDRVTGTLLSGPTININMVSIFNDTTTTGTLTRDNLNIISNTYSMFVASEGYKTEVRTFDFSNQENLSLDYYLLNLTDTNKGTLFVTTTDSFFRIISDAKVELLEYKPSQLSFVSVSECLTNINGECDFNIELNTKTYYLRATSIVDGTVEIAETATSGEIFTVDNDIRNLIFFKRTEFTVSPTNNLIYSISETFVNNISSISLEYSSFDGTAIDICIEYFKQVGSSYESVTGDTYCVTASSAIQNVDASVTLNRSNDYKAEVYIDKGSSKTLLKSYIYPSKTSTGAVFDDDMKGAIIMIAWLVALGFALHSKNIMIWFVLAIILSWVEILIFPLYSIVSFSVFKTIISVFTMTIARKKKDFQ